MDKQLFHPHPQSKSVANSLAHAPKDDLRGHPWCLRVKVVVNPSVMEQLQDLMQV